MSNPDLKPVRRHQQARIIKAITVLFGTIVVGVFILGTLSFTYLASGFPSHRFLLEDKMLLTLSLFVLALSISVFKVFSQLYYGLVECGLAVASTWTVLSNSLSANRATNAVLLVGCVYLMSRGLNNVYEGDAKKRADFDAIRKLIFKPTQTPGAPT
jgi:hypothetical protein